MNGRIRIVPCKVCGRLTRSGKLSAAQCPGTVVRLLSDMCGACVQRARRSGEYKPKRRAVNARPTDPVRLCARCGYPTREALCTDCEDVLTPAERAAWAPDEPKEKRDA